MQEVIGKFIIEMDYDESAECFKVTLSAEDASGYNYETIRTEYAETRSEADKVYTKFIDHATSH